MRNYVKGEQINTFDEFMKQEFIFHNNQVVHKGWFWGWTIHFAKSQIQSKAIFYAIKKGGNNNDING
jgi:hypothetical protein